MKCLNCGNENDHLLCSSCAPAENLDRIFNEICDFSAEACENPYLRELALHLEENQTLRDQIPELLAEFPEDTAAYYYCRYFRICRDSRFEEAALGYLNTHDVKELHSQRVLLDLIQSYIPDDFVKPGEWCERIAEDSGFCCELCAEAAKYFAMIGEYDRADALTDRGMECLQRHGSQALLVYSEEGMGIRLERQRADTLRYRTKKPYWPSTEARRRAVAVFYDKKGIKYPRIEKKPVKVLENEFAPLKEYFDGNLADYCAFWCSEAFSYIAAKDIFQIGAVRVREGKETDTFQSLIRPWSGGISVKRAAAKEAGISLEALEECRDVDQVMPQFFAFVGGDVLVSTGALGNQARLISRAARYAGMREIKNEFCDLLDLAADISEKFDFDHNSREYLLTYFGIDEGKSALQRAQANKRLYDALKEYGE